VAFIKILNTHKTVIMIQWNNNSYYSNYKNIKQCMSNI